MYRIPAEYYGEDEENDEELLDLFDEDKYDADPFYDPFADFYDEINDYIANLPGDYPEDFFFTPRARTPCSSCKSVRDILYEYDTKTRAERVTEDNICQFDVYKISHFVKILKVIDEEANKGITLLYACSLCNF